MFLFLFLSISSLQFANAQTTRNCYTCASEGLRNRWYLTGLPQVPDAYFTTSCINQAVRANTESCAGACFTMVFDNPDEVSGSTQITPTPFIVRGCHRTLTNVISDRTNSGYNNNNGSKFCEIDTTYRMADKGGNMVNVRMMSVMCTDRDLCNQDEYTTDFTNGVMCSNQTNNNLLNNAPLNCYNCIPTEGNNCHESKCTKKYCSKQQVKLDGGFQLLKTCSNVNIYGVDNVCQTFDVFTNPGGVPVKSQYTQCFCKDKQFCNSSDSRDFLISLMVSIASVVASFYF